MALQSTEGHTLMRALVYTPSIPKYLAARLLGKRYPARALPLRLAVMPEPVPPPGFERLKVRLCGICGSDLALLYGKNSPVLSPFFSFPAVLGHEVLAELGGVRVVVNPLLTCRDRGLPECKACAGGNEPLCQNVAEGNLSAGIIGFCHDLPGGWSQRMVAHKDRLVQVQSGVPDERAVLAEPLAVVVRGLRQGFLGGWPEKMLVIGAGTIGLLSVKALRLLGFSGELHVVARRARQAELAKGLGASQVHGSAKAAQQVVAKRYRGMLGTSGWRGGFGGVVEAAGSPAALQDASWAVEEGGRLLLLGAPGASLHDLSPYWFREIHLTGSYTYSREDFAEAVRLLPEAVGLEALVSASYPLAAWPEAIRAAATRKGVKVAFKP